MSVSKLTTREDKLLIPIPKEVPTCYYCGSTDTHDIVTNDKGTYLKIYSRCCGEGGYYYCKRCHKLFMILDRWVGNIVKLLFKVKRKNVR